MRWFHMPVLFASLVPLLTAGSCDSHTEQAEPGPVWSRACSADDDCVLVERPCVYCGEVDAISASERQRYTDHRLQVHCDHEEQQDVCGSTAPQRASCEAGQCVVVLAE